MGIQRNYNIADHWTVGGTMVTRFLPCDRATYQKAVEQFGDLQLFIKDDALHALGMPRELGPFWRVFDALRSAHNASIDGRCTPQQEQGA